MSRPKTQTVLLSLAVALALVGTAGGAAMLVRDRMTAEHVFDKARALAEQRWHHDNAMDAVRAEPRVIERVVGIPASMPVHTKPRPSTRAHTAPHGKRQPGDDSADALNRRQLRAE